MPHRSTASSPRRAPPAERLSTCECGALRLRMAGDPVHGHACTCTRCQRASGSVMTLSAWFPEAYVTIEGAHHTYFYTGAADPQRMAGFCPICGGGRFFRNRDYLPDNNGIRVGNFADPGFPAPDHIGWWPDRPCWLGAPVGPILLQGN